MDKKIKNEDIEDEVGEEDEEDEEEEEEEEKLQEIEELKREEINKKIINKFNEKEEAFENKKKSKENEKQNEKEENNNGKKSNEIIPHLLKYNEDTKRRYSLYENYKKKEKNFKSEYKIILFDEKKDKIWSLMDKYLPKNKSFLQESILKHIEYTLGKNRFQINNEAFYYGTSLTVRDCLLERWNDTELFVTINNPKKV